MVDNMSDKTSQFFHVQIYTSDSEWEPLTDISEEILRERVIQPYYKMENLVANGRTIRAKEIYRISVFRTEVPWQEHAEKRENHYDWGTDVTNELITKPQGSERDLGIA